MNEKLLDLLNGQEELYPINLEERFERIVNRIVDLWDTPEIDDYFTDLMVDNRGGTRQGFPQNVAAEIVKLSMAHARIREQNQKVATGVNPWENLDESKKAAIEEQGY